MQLITKRTVWLLLMVCAIGISSCKKWDDHLAPDGKVINETLTEHIQKKSNLSKFAEYLKATGLDEEIGSSKNYTVWAPTNEALGNLSADIVNDKEKLKQFLLNHISGQLFFSRMASDEVRIQMLNGKRNTQNNMVFSGADILEADIALKNGVLHVIDKAVAPLPNVWEFIRSTRNDYLQNNYVASLVHEVQDPSKAEVDGIDPITGEPIYVPGTGMVEINAYLTKVYDLSNEDSLYTYVVLKNPVYTSALDDQKPFFKSNDPDTTAANAAWNVVKDLAIKGLYKPNQLQQALLSRFNVHVNVNSSNIESIHEASNGIVYVVDNMSFAMNEKIPEFRIEGENPHRFSNTTDNFIAKIMYRERLNPFTNERFKDIYLNLGSSGLNEYIEYVTNNLYTTKYQVYAVCISDRVISGLGDDAYGTDSVLTQTFQFGKYTAARADFVPDFESEKTVEKADYNEIYIGEIENLSYDWLLSFPERLPDGTVSVINPATQAIRVKAPSATKTGIPNNLTLDYLRFVPVF